MTDHSSSTAISASASEVMVAEAAQCGAPPDTSAPLPPPSTPATMGTPPVGATDEATAVLPRRPLIAPGPGSPFVAPGPFPPRPTPAAVLAPSAMPAWEFPPHYSPAQRRSWWQGNGSWIASASAVVVVTACVGLGIHEASGSDGPADIHIDAASASNTTSAQPGPSAAPSATMPLAALPGVRLDVAAINDIEGATNLAPRLGMSGDSFAYLAGDNDRPECGEVHGVALQNALDNSGYVAVRTQALDDPHQDEHIVDDAAEYFSTGQAARDFVAKQAQSWPKCNGLSVRPTPAPGKEPSTWMVGTVTNRDGMLTVISTQEGGEGWQCQRAMTARYNVVIDVRDCGMNRTDQAITIATRMADRVIPR